MPTLRPAIASTLLISSLFLAPAALADTFEGTIDDDARSWHILEHEGDSTANFADEHGLLMVSIQGHAEPRFTTQGTLSINFTLMNGQLIDEAEVMYLSETSMFPNYMAVEGSGELTLEQYSVDGDTARFSGRYRGELVRHESMFSEPDEDEAVSVDVRFDVEATRQDL